MSLALAPKHTWRHCSVALLPEPFSPLMKFRCGLRATSTFYKLAWNASFMKYPTTTNDQ